MKKSGFLIIFVVMVFLVSGCVSSSGGSNPSAGMQVATLSGTPERGTLNLPTPQVNPTADLGPFILMQDDFNDPASGWEIYSGDYGAAGYEDGGYVVEAIVDKEYNWGIAGVNYDNIRIDVDVAVLQAPGDLVDGFGVDCRVQENGDGYGFRISSDGQAEIMLYANDESTGLSDWAENSAINTDGETNHMTAICQGNHFSLIVNDALVADVIDDTFVTGDLALSAITFSDDPVKVIFDDIIVQSIGNPYQYEDTMSYPVTIENASGREVCWVNISADESDYWGESWLTGAQTFGTGDTLTFDDNFDQLVDIQVLDCDYTRLFESYGQDLAINDYFVLHEPVVRVRYEFNTNEGWSLGEMKGGSAAITQGDYYSLTTHQGEPFSFGVVDFVAQDITLRADASLAKTGDPTKDIYGVMCRVQNDGSGIFFAVRSDGYGSIQKWDGTSLTMLTDWIAMDSVRQGIAANYIEGNCVGDNYMLIINGDYVTDVDNSDFLIGNIGVGVVPQSASETRVDFDFVEVLEPLE